MRTRTIHLFGGLGVLLTIAACGEGTTGPSGPLSEERKPPFIDCSSVGPPSATACLKGSPPPP